MDGDEDGPMVDVPWWFLGLSPTSSTPPNLLSTTRTPQLSHPGSITFFFPTIYSLSPPQQVTSSSPGLNSPRPTYLKDHSADTRGLLPVGLPPPSAPPHSL